MVYPYLELHILFYSNGLAIWSGFQILRTNFTFWWAQKLKKFVIFLNFNVTFLATFGCAIDFLKMLSKFKMAARSQLQIF